MKRLFILGAGSSVEYGYPTGIGLLNIIQNDFVEFLNNNIDLDIDFSTRSDFDSFNEFKEFAEEFVSVLKETRPPSIDIFLSRNPGFDFVGKIAIAYVILRCEHSCSSQNFQLYNDDRHWQRFLLQRLTANHSSSNLENLNLDASFITFNYDRSFEHTFFEFFKRNFRSADHDSITSHLNIKHVFGSVSQTRPNGKYGLEPSLRNVLSCSKNLQVMYENRTNKGLSEDFKSAYDLKEFEEVYFLGLSYNKFNLDLLGLENFGNGVKILGTGLELSERDTGIAKQNVRDLDIYSVNCLDLLRRHI